MRNDVAFWASLAISNMWAAAGNVFMAVVWMTWALVLWAARDFGKD